MGSTLEKIKALIGVIDSQDGVALIQEQSLRKDMSIENDFIMLKISL